MSAAGSTKSSTWVSAMARIAALAPDPHRKSRAAVLTIPHQLARAVIDAAEVGSPGPDRLHAHVYTGVCPLTVSAAEVCASTGVTTIVSAGDAGATNRRLSSPGRGSQPTACWHFFTSRPSDLPAGRRGGTMSSRTWTWESCTCGTGEQRHRGRHQGPGAGTAHRRR